MLSIRRALVVASVGRYIATLLNLATSVVIARLVTPSEVGVAVIGIAVYAIAEALRELGGGAYLVQTKAVDFEKINTNVTISTIVTTVISAALLLLAEPLASYYRVPALEQYIRVTTIAFSMGPLYFPILALMQRELDMAALSLIAVVVAFANGVGAIAFALLGLGHMSFAWASVLSAAAGVAMAIYYRPQFLRFRPTLRYWRGVLAISTYESSFAVLLRLSENLPYLILSQFLKIEAIGLYQRTLLLCQSPERVVLTGVGSIALPMFARQVHQQENLKDGYLQAITNITAVMWPILILLSLLTYPVVSVLLGSQWIEIVPLVKIVAIALLFSFPVSLNYPILVAVGAIRHLPILILAQGIIGTVALLLTVQHGLHAVALSYLVAVPLAGALSITAIRWHVQFRMCELLGALWKSAVAALAAAVGPMFVVLSSGSGIEPSVPAAAVAIILSFVGWLAGLLVTRHQMWQELVRAGTTLGRSPFAARVQSGVRVVGERIYQIIGRKRRGSLGPPDTKITIEAVPADRK